MRRAAFLVVAALAAWSFGGVSLALDALGPPVSGVALVRFGERYGSERQRTHCGLDLAGAPGEPVRAPCSGEVVFAGLIPADGGGRTGAVTIEPEEGVAVTVSPLETVTVVRGEAVESGASIGELSAAGDASCFEPHLHLSVRRDGRYVDPEPLLQQSVSVRARAQSPSGTEPDAVPSSLSGRQPQPAQTVGQPAASPCFRTAVAAAGAALQARPAASRMPEGDAGLRFSVERGDALGVRAAHWRAAAAREAIRCASRSSPAVEREAAQGPFVQLQPLSVPVRGTAGAVVAAMAGCAAASVRRRFVTARE